MSDEAPSPIGRISRALAEIGHVLESLEQSGERITRALALLDALVPYQQCALLEALPDTEPALLALPAPDEAEQRRLRRSLGQTLSLITDLGELPPSEGPHLHLALPLIGLDRIVGILRVDASDAVTYDADHLRLFSVVASQLGAYLANLHLRAQEVRHTRELEAAHDFQQVLVGVVSHDLRNPLAAISASAALLQRRNGNPKLEQATARIVASTRRAERIIHDLLDVTDARARGGIPVTLEPVDLAAALESLIDEVRTTSPERTIALRLLGDASARCDPERIVQAVMNLLSNALKYGDREHAVEVALRGEGGALRIAVHNRGPVLPPGALASIADPFKRGESTRERKRGEGLGLGLYIVDQIIRAHAGRLELHSTDADGTTFTLVLPRSPPEPREAAPGP